MREKGRFSQGTHGTKGRVLRGFCPSHPAQDTLHPILSRGSAHAQGAPGSLPPAGRPFTLATAA